MRPVTYDATFYGGLKHATTLNRFFSSLFKLGSVPQEFNSRNTKSEKMRNHFCSEDLVRLFQSDSRDRRLLGHPTWHFLPARRSEWCRFGVTQRFWTNMLVSFWLIYPMFFVGVILSSIYPQRDFYLADGVHLNPSGQYLLSGGYFRNFWVGMYRWDPGTLNLHQS